MTAKTLDALVAARQSFTGNLSGKAFTAHQGELFEAGHPAVKKWPTLFGPVPDVRTSPVIEQATAAPGEQRVR